MHIIQRSSRSSRYSRYFKILQSLIIGQKNLYKVVNKYYVSEDGSFLCVLIFLVRLAVLVRAITVSLFCVNVGVYVGGEIKPIKF